MATRDDIYTAIRNADAAGDTASVQKLGAYLQTLPADAAPATPATPAPVQAPQAGTLESFVGGALKPIDNLVSVARKYAPGVVAAGDRLGQAVGLPSSGAAVTSNDALRTRSAPTARALGEVASTMFVPGGQTKLGMLAGNAASGALLSDAKDPMGVVKDAATSGVTGAATQGLFRVASGAIAPKLSEGVKALRDAGIPLTIGQAMGGVAKSVEDKITSIPFVGDMVQNARNKGTVGFNAAILSKALAPIGAALPAGLKAGHEAIKYVGDTLSNAYNALTPHLAADVDQPFLQGINSATQSVATLPTARQDQFQAIIKDALGNRAPGGQFAGQALKDAETKLTSLASRYGKSSDVDQQIMGDAIGEVRDHLRDMVLRQNPTYAPQLQALNQGWATLVQAEKAGGAGAAGSTGVFTPKQFTAALRSTDNSVRGRAIARGTARNQQIADAAANILPATIPDSGTSGRAMVGMGATAIAGGGLGAMAHPGLAVGAGLLAAPYTTAGQYVTNGLLARRSPAMEAFAQKVAAAGIPASRLAAAGVPALLARPQ